jgi:acyl-coenzyme A synthetase/AMP-(fatty) acid ligase
MQLVRQIVFQARLNEAAPAIAHAGGVASYGVLAHIVEAVVGALEALDLPTGTPVLLDIRDPLHHTAAILALALLGLPSGSIGASFAVERVGILPGLLLTDRDGAALEGVATHRLDERWFAYDQARPVDYARLLALRGFASPDAVVRYVYSSGTTGFPKAVALTATVLERRIFHTMLTTAQPHQGAALNMMGFSTIAGIMAPLMALPVGMMLCFAQGNAEALQMIRLFKVSMLALAVVQLRGFMSILANEPPPDSLELVAVSGARISTALLNEARARLCSNVVMGYGSTEMGSMTGGNAVSLGRFDGSAGFVRPWVDMQAVDTNGQPVPVGTDGILRARSPEMAFYATPTTDPAETIRDGWFYPGDVGRIYADGLVVITGRTTEVINRGGVIVAPELVEEVLRLDPAVRDVAVVGVPVAGIDEIWAAVVSDQPIDAQAMANRAAERLNEKTPNRILRVDAIPRNENGKVRRGELRDLLMNRVRLA